MRVELYSKYYNPKTKCYCFPILDEISATIETKDPEISTLDRKFFGDYYPDFKRAYDACLFNTREVRNFCAKHSRAKKVIVFMSNEEHLAICVSANYQMYQAQKHHADVLFRDIRAHRKAVQACLGAQFEERYFDRFLEQARAEIAEDPREMYTQGTKDSRRREAEYPTIDDEELNKLYREVFKDEEEN